MWCCTRNTVWHVYLSLLPLEFVMHQSAMSRFACGCGFCARKTMPHVPSHRSSCDASSTLSRLRLATRNTTWHVPLSFIARVKCNYVIQVHQDGRPGRSTLSLKHRADRARSIQHTPPTPPSPVEQTPPQHVTLSYTQATRSHNNMRKKTRKKAAGGERSAAKCAVTACPVPLFYHHSAFIVLFFFFRLSLRGFLSLFFTIRLLCILTEPYASKNKTIFFAICWALLL